MHGQCTSERPGTVLMIFFEVTEYYAESAMKNALSDRRRYSDAVFSSLM